MLVLHTDNWVVKQQVCGLRHLTGEEVARLLVGILSAELGVTHMQFFGSCNVAQSICQSVAMSIVSILYNHLFDVRCFSHSLDHVGEQMATPTLDTFTKVWIGMFSYSPKTRLAWSTQTGEDYDLQQQYAGAKLKSSIRFTVALKICASYWR